MTVDPISSYSSQSLGSDLERDRGQARQLLNALVSTRTVGVQLGKLGVSLRTQDISFSPETAPAFDADFAQELELRRLTLHVEPFKPAGVTSQNANLQRIGALAYARQALQTRSVNPMISVTV